MALKILQLTLIDVQNNIKNSKNYKPYHILGQKKLKTKFIIDHFFLIICIKIRFHENEQLQKFANGISKTRTAESLVCVGCFFGA